MRRLPGKFPHDNKRYFEYYKSNVEPYAENSNPGLRSTSLQSNSTPWSSETLTSQERKQYKKALKGIYETVKSKAKRLETDAYISDGNIQSDTDKMSSQITSESPNSCERLHDFQESRNKEKKKLTEIELQEIYQELRVISQKLKHETRELQAWEQDLYERETILQNNNETVSKQELVDENFQEELERRCTILEEEYQESIDQLEKDLHEKTKEANRLRDSFNTIRNTHEELRKQFLDVQDQNRVLESQTLSLQQRLNNLLRRNEHQAKQREEEKLVKVDENLSKNVKCSKDDSMKFSGTSKVNLSGMLDVLASLLIWISDSQLDYTVNNLPERSDSENQTLSKEHIYGKCVKILPPLADLLCYLPTVNPNVMSPLLKFIYSVILYMDRTHQCSQKPALTSTLRRIGEELYKPEVIKQSESLSLDVKRGKCKVNVFIRSSNLEERMLSTLIVLKTTSRADHLSHTFDVLKSDLRDDGGKRLFILHKGVHVVLPFIKQKNQTIVEYAVDVILQMSMESSVVSDFLACCSTSDFFNVCTSLVQGKGLDMKILEKASIVLQRLSKIRSNRRYFEAFQLIPLMQDLLREHDANNAFLSLNLRSILVNLNVTKTV